MKISQLDKIIDQAERQCRHSGARLTLKRKRVLEVLLQSAIPLSAYDVAGEYNKNVPIDIHAMSVYRILEFLEGQGLIHKIHSANKFMVCSHLDGRCSHGVPQFLVCKKCNQVKEIMLPQDIVEQLASLIKDYGYRMSNSQLELQCQCDQCSFTIE